MTHLSDKVVTTRKSHRCWGCGSVYLPNTRMRTVTSVDDSILTTYWCVVCDNYWKDHMDTGDEIGQGDLSSESHYREYAIKHGKQLQFN